MRARAPKSFRSTVAISKLRKQTKEGTFTLVFDHEPEQSTANRQRQFRTVFVKSDNPTLVSQETNIRVEQDGSGSRVTITAVATVSTHSAMSICTRHPAIPPRHAQTAREPLRRTNE